MSLPGWKVLLMGTTGAGKTTSIKTLLDQGLEVFAIFTEPRYDVLGQEVLDKIHFRYIAPAANSWSGLMQTAKLVNQMSNESLQKMNQIAGNEYTQFIDILGLCNNFVDQHGKSFGDVATWGTDRILWVDGLTGISKMARKLKAGGKPVLTQPDWGVSMTMVQEFVDTLVTGTFCHFVLVTHIEREIDELTGASRTMVSTLGRKLAPMIPPNFGDVVLAKKEGTEFSWSTAEAGVDLKGAFLPIRPKLPPSFGPLMEQWKAKGGVLGTKPPVNWQSGQNK
jgi:Cdc6-like AAA superfamily ATPase